MLKLWGISAEKIRAATVKDNDLQQVLTFIATKWPGRKHVPNDIITFWHNRNEFEVDDGILTRDDRIVIPSELRRQLLHDAHMGHPGIVRMKRILRELYWWPNMDKEIEYTCKTCTACQQSEKSTACLPKVPATLPQAERSGQLFSIDIAGPFHTAPMHQRFLVVLLDHFSGYPEVLATQNIQCRTIIKWLHEQFSRYGNPEKLLSDNGPQFISEEFEDFLRSRDIEHLRTPVYNPQSNGKVERFNRFLKFGLQAYAESQTEWKIAIEDLLSQYRATAARPGLKSPAEMFLGRKIRLPFEVVNRPSIRPTIPAQQGEDQDRTAHLHCRGPYQVGDMVMYKRPQVLKGQPPYSKPMLVTAVLGNWTYRLQNGSVWNARKLKRFYDMESLNTEPGSAQSRTRSRRTRARLPTRILPERSTRGQTPDYFVKPNM